MNTFKQTILGIITITIFAMSSLKSFEMIIPVTGELVSDEITCSFDINFNNQVSLDGKTQKTGHQDCLEISTQRENLILKSLSKGTMADLMFHRIPMS